MSEQPAKGFVLVVVVNFIDSVFDTDQISIFRGGSELARWLPYHLQGLSYRVDSGGISEPYTGCDQLHALSLGGSQGLYAANEPEAVAAHIAAHLSTHTSYQYLSIAVAGVQAATVQHALPELRAKIAWQQMQSHRVRPDFVRDATEVCALTGVRAAALEKAVFRDGEGTKSLPVSPSVLLRLKFGRQLRKNGLLLQSVAKADPGVFDAYHLSDNFEDISGKPTNDELGKIAYLYWDGNSFGKFNARAEKAGKTLEWDTYLRDRRAELMAAIIESADALGLVSNSITDPDSGKPETDKKLLRLEPLLWGGDESLLVLPAAAALPLLYFIQQRTCQWQFSFDGSTDTQALSHAFGLLICSAKTPVREARSMAANLAELGKGGADGRKRDSWTFAALSSIDYDSTGNMANYLASRYGEALAPAFHGLSFCKERTEPLAATACIIEAVSRGQLRRLAGSLVASNQRQLAEENFAWQRMLKQLDSGQAASVRDAIEQLSLILFGQSADRCLERDGAVWALLEELYSYLPKRVKGTEEGAHAAV